MLVLLCEDLQPGLIPRRIESFRWGGFMNKARIVSQGPVPGGAEKDRTDASA